MRPQMKKLNFGCGSRYAAGWTNIDFHGDGNSVIRANLLAGFPFPDCSFDAVYSSHVLEHFTPEQGSFLVEESYRVLKAGGTLRIVVPDLEASCTEYLRILSMDDSDPAKPAFYDWIKLELLDQLVRVKSEGAMGPLINSTRTNGDRSMNAYIQSRTESYRPPPDVSNPTSRGKLAKVTRGRVASALTYAYLEMIKRLVPKALRPMVWSETRIGERHRWMYDRYGLALLMRANGFKHTRFYSFNESAIEGFCEDRLDANPDGTPYKNVSLYCEATKLLAD
jgi:SAM-dependent methyltransferase